MPREHGPRDAAEYAISGLSKAEQGMLSGALEYLREYRGYVTPGPEFVYNLLLDVAARRNERLTPFDIQHHVDTFRTSFADALRDATWMTLYHSAEINGESKPDGEPL